jgi:hypothetical protein
LCDLLLSLFYFSPFPAFRLMPKMMRRRFGYGVELLFHHAISSLLFATNPPFAIGKPFLRQPRGDTRATPEDQRVAIARRNAEIKERRAIFAANANANADTPTNTP